MAEADTIIPLSPKIRKRQGRTRQRILDESARKFIEKGFENVSVEDIIDAAEIARSSFYRFFANREQVLASIIRPVFEQGLDELDAIKIDDPFETMASLLNTWFKLWQTNADALRVSTRIGGIYFYLFEDEHRAFREKVAEMLHAIEPSGIFLNDSADSTARLLARTVVPVLEVYSDQPDFENLYRKTMTGFLLKTEKVS
jgi:AcrR family transcriptional regulator